MAERRIIRGSDLRFNSYLSKFTDRDIAILFSIFDENEILSQSDNNLALCESPIEEMFYIACLGLAVKLGNSDFILQPQEEIEVNNKHYRADFLYVHKDYKLVIECDGHEFHEKTKEQVIKDNEQDYNLKQAGYDVLHFSGSQIYKNPVDCAKKTLRYIHLNILESEV